MRNFFLVKGTPLYKKMKNEKTQSTEAIKMLRINAAIDIAFDLIQLHKDARTVLFHLL